MTFQYLEWPDFHTFPNRNGWKYVIGNIHKPIESYRNVTNPMDGPAV